MKNFAELKRKLQPGVKLILVERFGKKIENPQPRSIIKVQSNAIVLEKIPGVTGVKNGSWLEFPPASLVEITENGFKFYYPGDRDLTSQEKEIMDNQPRDEKQEEIDAISDGNTMFWRRESYFKEKDAMHLRGHEIVHGMRYNFNNGKVTDNKIKGDLALEYVFT